jgi:hypothetical protein
VGLSTLLDEGALGTVLERALAACGVEVHDGLRRDVIRIAAQGPPFV